MPDTRKEGGREGKSWGAICGPGALTGPPSEQSGVPFRWTIAVSRADLTMTLWTCLGSCRGSTLDDVAGFWAAVVRGIAASHGLTGKVTVKQEVAR